MAVAPQKQVVYNTNVFEEFDILKSTGDPQFCSLVWFEMGDVHAVQEYFTLAGTVNAADAVEQ